MSNFCGLLKAVVLSAFLHFPRIDSIENTVGTLHNCTEFASEFVGCWKNLDSDDDTVFLNGTKIITKNDNGWNLHANGLLCSANEVVVSGNAVGRHRSVCVRLSNDRKRILMSHQSEGKCDYGNNSTFRSMEVGMDVCFNMSPTERNGASEGDSPTLTRIVRSTEQRKARNQEDDYGLRKERHHTKERHRKAPTVMPMTKAPKGANIKGAKSPKIPKKTFKPTGKPGKKLGKIGPTSMPSSKKKGPVSMPSSKKKGPAYIHSKKGERKKKKGKGRAKFDMKADATAKVLSSRLDINPPVKRRPLGKFGKKSKEKKGFDKVAPKPVSQDKLEKSMKSKKGAGKFDKGKGSKRKKKKKKGLLSKKKFNKKLKKIEKDIKKPEGKENRAKDKDKKSKKKMNEKENMSKAKKQESSGSFEKDVDLKAGELSEGAKKDASLPRDRTQPKHSKWKENEGKFNDKITKIAERFAKGKKDSPKDFDKLVDSVAQDLSKYIPSNRKKDKVFIPRGKTVTLDCLKDEETHSPIPSMKAKWTKDQQPLAEGRYEITGQGDLKIKEVESHDTGVYRCEGVVRTKDKKQQSVTRYHKVMVYRFPIVSYFFAIKFETSSCSSVKTDDVLSDFRKKVCGTADCALKDLLSKCPAGNNKLYIEGNVVLPKGYKMASNCAVPSCKVKAMKEDLMKELDNVKKFVSDYKSTPGSYGKITDNVYTLIYSCESGYEQDNLMCVPCYPGFYSPEGDPSCHRCPKNTYQENFGALRCLNCPNKGKTMAAGSTSKVNCQIFILTALGKKLPGNTVLLYIGCSVGVLGFILFILGCVMCCKGGGKKSDKTKEKTKKSKKQKGRKKQTIEAEEDENENNSNLMKVPLLKASQPKYDKNSQNLRKTEESKSVENTNVNNQPYDASPAAGFTSSYTEFETNKVDKLKKMKSTVRSMSESVANNSMAARNAVLQEKSDSSKVRTESEVSQEQCPPNLKETNQNQKRRSGSSHSIRSARSRGQPHQGRRRYAHHHTSGDDSVERKGTSRSRSPLKREQSSYSQNSPYTSPEQPIFSTPPEAPKPPSSVHSSAVRSTYSTPSEGLHPAKHAESWYTSNWESTDGGETLTTLSTLPAESSGTDISSSNSTRTVRNADSWYSNE